MAVNKNDLLFAELDVDISIEALHFSHNIGITLNEEVKLQEQFRSRHFAGLISHSKTQLNEH